MDHSLWYGNHAKIAMLNELSSKWESNPENDRKNAMMKPAIITHEYSDRDSCPWRKLMNVQFQAFTYGASSGFSRVF